jgi:hypothetical protein
MVAALAVLIGSASCAEAMQAARNGSTVTLTGRIRAGDQFRFREAVAGGGVAIVDLNVPGGDIGAARDIARDIRAAGMTTVVDASRSTCASACTPLFLAGARRHYVNAGAIADQEGPKDRRGLGFHEGSALAASGRREQSGRATAGLINLYYELGVPAAAALATRASNERMYYISGQTALSLGIATSLARP